MTMMSRERRTTSADENNNNAHVGRRRRSNDDASNNRIDNVFVDRNKPSAIKKKKTLEKLLIDKEVSKIQKEDWKPEIEHVKGSDLRKNADGKRERGKRI